MARNITLDDAQLGKNDVGLFVPGFIVTRRENAALAGGCVTNVRNIDIQTAIQPGRTLLLTGDAPPGTLNDSELGKPKKPRPAESKDGSLPVEYFLNTEETKLKR